MYSQTATNRLKKERKKTLMNNLHELGKERYNASTKMQRNVRKFGFPYDEIKLIK